MTIFAVMCAGMFPGIHVGRIWFAYWLAPLPNQMAMWPNFRSPLLWDVFAVSTYFTVSLMFWYMGMIPDLATFRDRAKTRVRQIIYGLLALGWRGSTRHWHRYERAYLLLAALATPLVLTVHSVVSFDFAVSQLPGWHTTIFPPYFVAGAIFGGFAMVLTLVIPARQFFGLKDIITLRHLENMSKIMLPTGMHGRLRLRDRVLHRLVQRQPLREFHLPEPRLRPVRLGLLDHDHLQRARPAALLVQEGAHQRLAHLPGRDVRERRHVVRAVRDHLSLAVATSCPRAGHYFSPDLGRPPAPWSAASACSSRCSCCSAATCRWSRWPRSRPSCRTRTRTRTRTSMCRRRGDSITTRTSMTPVQRQPPGATRGTPVTHPMPPNAHDPHGPDAGPVAPRCMACWPNSTRPARW